MNRIITPLLVVALAVSAASVPLIVFHAGAASAQGAPSAAGLGGVPAVAAPQSSADLAADVDWMTRLWRSGAVTSAAIVAFWLALVLASAHVAWLRADHRAVYVSAALGGLTMLVDAVQRGVTPTLSMVVTALGVTVALAQNPKKPAEKTPTPGAAS